MLYDTKLSQLSKDRTDTEGLVQLIGYANVDGLERGMRVKIPFGATRVDQRQAFNVRHVNGLLGKKV